MEMHQSSQSEERNWGNRSQHRSNGAIEGPQGNRPQYGEGHCGARRTSEWRPSHRDDNYQPRGYRQDSDDYRQGNWRGFPPPSKHYPSRGRGDHQSELHNK